MSNATTRSLSNRMIIDLKKIPKNYRSIVTTIGTSLQNLMADGIKPANINFAFAIDRLVIPLLSYLKWTIFYLSNRESAFAVFPEFLAQITLLKFTRN